MDPETFQPHVLPDGTMWAKVLKALYGAGDASKLWHNLVHDTLIKHAFVVNPYDRCVLAANYILVESNNF